MPWLDRLGGGVARLAGTRGAILCFHGLEVPGERSGSSLHVSMEQFERVVEAVHGLGRLVPLREIVGRYLAGRRTAGQVAVTADDGYASWLLAEGFLARKGIPFTIFAVSGALAAMPRFWWDRIDDAAFRARPGRWRQF